MKLTPTKSPGVVVQPQPKAAPPPAPQKPTAPKLGRDELSTGRGGALRRAAASRLGASTTTTLRTERLGDGNANCLEHALKLASPNDQIVLLDDSRDASGHALVQHPDGSITDPNFPQVRYQSLGQWQAANPTYSVAARVNAGAAQQALKLAPGVARDSALAALGLSKAADIAVADEDPSWVIVNGNVRDPNQPSTVLKAASGVPAQVLGEVTDPELLKKLQTDFGAPGAWYEVRLDTGEVGYVWSQKTTTEFPSVLSNELGAPTTPMHHDEDGHLTQRFENGSVTMRNDGTRVVTTNDGVVREVPPQWAQIKENGIVRNAQGQQVRGLGGEPIQILRTITDAEEKTLGLPAGEWSQARLNDGTMIYVRADNLDALTADQHVSPLVPAALGAPTSPMLPSEGGGFHQTFEHGSVTIDGRGNVTVANASGETVATRESHTTTSVAEANAYQVTQRTYQRKYTTNDAGVPVDGAGNPVGNAYNDGSEWYGFNDCGPTSIVMAVSLVGGMAHPDAAHAGEAIDAVRDSILDYDSTASETMGVEKIAEGVNESGAVAVTHTPASMAEVDAALAAGNPVILGGDPMDAWGADDANYLERGSSGFNHWVCVSGRTANGNYIVNDPLCPDGAREVTPAQLEAYLHPGMGMVEVMPK